MDAPLKMVRRLEILSALFSQVLTFVKLYNSLDLTLIGYGATPPLPDTVMSDDARPKHLSVPKWLSVACHAQPFRYTQIIGEARLRASLCARHPTVHQGERSPLLGIYPFSQAPEVLEV